MVEIKVGDLNLHGTYPDTTVDSLCSKHAAICGGKCAPTDNLNDCAALLSLYSSVTFQNGTRLPWKMDGSTSLWMSSSGRLLEMCRTGCGETYLSFHCQL